MGGDFIARYYGNGRSRGLIFLGSYPNPGCEGAKPQLYTRDAKLIAAFNEDWDIPGQGVFHGVNTIDPKYRQRVKERIYEFCAFYADIDFKDLVESPEEIVATLQQLACPPTCIVFTGHGVHPLWFLVQALGREYEERYCSVLERLITIVGADPKVHDITRISRLPGSHNSKAEAVECTVEHESNRFYTLEKLEAFVAPIAQPLLHRIVKDSDDPVADVFWMFGCGGSGLTGAPADVEQLLKDMSPGNIHNTQLSVSASLLQRGWDIEDIVELLLIRTMEVGRSDWDWAAEDRRIRDLTMSFVHKLEIEQRAQEKKVGQQPDMKVNGVDLTDFWKAEEPPELPRGLLPKLIDDFAFARARQMGADPAAIAFSALGCCSCLIPNYVHIKPKVNENWRESAIIWVMLIAPIGGTKSPAMKCCVDKIRELDNALINMYSKMHANWKGLTPEQRKAVPEPRQRRIRIEDATIEAVQEVFRGDTDGVLLFRDELTGWFGMMESGGRSAGAQHAFWNSAFTGGSTVIDRIGRGTFVCANCGCSIVGAIPPEEIVRVIALGGNDGHVQRMLGIITRETGIEVDEPIGDVEMLYNERLEIMHNKPWDRLGAIRFEPKAQQIFEEIIQLYKDAIKLPEVSLQMLGHLNKYKGYFARLCLLFHCIEHAEHDVPPTIPGETAERVRTLMNTYLFHHARIFYGGSEEKTVETEMLRKIGSYLLRNPDIKEVNRRVLQRGINDLRQTDDSQFKLWMARLESSGWGLPMELRGIQRSGRLAVNQDIYSAFGRYVDKLNREVEACKKRMRARGLIVH